MEVFRKKCEPGCHSEKSSFREKLKRNLGNCVNFLRISVRSRVIHFADFFYVLFYCYRKNRLFAKVDSILWMEYFLDSPFAISKRYLQLKLDRDIYQYGETPILTVEKIANKAVITDQDHVFELGSGTGRCAFWLACSRNCKATGIEQIGQFVDFANGLAKSKKLTNTNFVKDDFLSCDFSQATVIYLYGTNMGNEQIEKLIFNLREINPETRIITVSYSLNEIIRESKNCAIAKNGFPIIETFSAEFAWGKADVYIQKKEFKYPEGSQFAFYNLHRGAL